MAISNTSTHFRLIIASMPFRYLVNGVLGNFHDQIPISHSSLAGQARLRLKPPRLVQHVVFQLIGLFQRVESFTNHDVTGGAGAGLFASMFDFDAVTQSGIQHGLTYLRLDNGAFRALFSMGQNNDLRHSAYSSISLSCRPASAALTVASSRRAAKASVILVRRWVCCSMATPSSLSCSARSASISASMA